VSYDTRGHVFEALGQNNKAILDFRRALALDETLETSLKGLERLGAN